MAKKGRIWHESNVFKAKYYINKKPKKKKKKVGFLMGIILFIKSLVPQLEDKGRGYCGENCDMMYKGRVRGFKRRISTDKDIARALHRSWMRSRGHKRNILNRNFELIGVGVKRRGNKFYATQVFYA